jgi:hypothetical protein
VKTYNWTHLFGKHGHHRYFRAEDGRIAVADDSGHFPQNTDDGVLFVDIDRPILARDDYFSIPLLDENGKQSRTLASALEGLRLASITGQPVGPGETLEATEFFTVAKRHHRIEATA